MTPTDRGGSLTRTMGPGSNKSVSLSLSLSSPLSLSSFLSSPLPPPSTQGLRRNLRVSSNAWIDFDPASCVSNRYRDKLGRTNQQVDRVNRDEAKMILKIHTSFNNWISFIFVSSRFKRIECKKRYCDYFKMISRNITYMCTLLIIFRKNLSR